MLHDSITTASSYGFLANLSQANSYYQRIPYRNALDADCYYIQKNPYFQAPYVPKPGSHDDGPYNGPLLGGIGTANFALDALGYFNRWQLQQGVHIFCPIDTAYFVVSWEADGNRQCKKLRIGPDSFDAAHVSYCAMFPYGYHTFDDPKIPFTLILRSFSPTIPHNETDSILPVTLFQWEVIPRGNTPCQVSLGFIWPNLVGWRQPYRSSEQEPTGRLWPTQQNAGNYSKLAHKDANRVHIVQSKRTFAPRQDVEGNAMLSLDCPGWVSSFDAMFKESRATTGNPDQQQAHTIGQVEYLFAHTGAFSMSETSWEAHWHEVTASALGAQATLTNAPLSLSFAITMDFPITAFGMGRRWYKAYTTQFGSDCSRTLELANYALDQQQRWEDEIYAFHMQHLEQPSPLSKRVLGAQINELYFVPGGGSVLVTEPVEGHTPETRVLDTPLHYGILEGFDNGYYYYNTLDLWVYAFAALSKNWPGLAKSGFDDYLASAALHVSHKNMIYRSGTLEDNLRTGKLPHDLGGCAEDLFVRVNGYAYRDDPNMWKDHNPSFVSAFYLHKQLLGEAVTAKEYKALKQIMEYTCSQDPTGNGLPIHDEFGDSTWDNLHMQGLSSYCAGLCIGAWAVMHHLAVQMNDPDAEKYHNYLTHAQQRIQTLWNGKYFVTSAAGKYLNATMSDALFGVVLAYRAGLTDLLPEEQIRSHLRSVYENNVAAYQQGTVGSLLVAEPGIQRYAQDGGDELQVNEVIVGSAWILTASLLTFGLEREGKALSETLTHMIYGGTGLQFRTPAAWDNAGHYRAPMNMRPLAIWMC